MQIRSHVRNWILIAIIKAYFTYFVIRFACFFNDLILNNLFRDFPGGTVVKNPPANAGDRGSSPGPGRSHMPRNI